MYSSRPLRAIGSSSITRQVSFIFLMEIILLGDPQGESHFKTVVPVFDQQFMAVLIEQLKPTLCVFQSNTSAVAIYFPVCHRLAGRLIFFCVKDRKTEIIFLPAEMNPDLIPSGEM